MPVFHGYKCRKDRKLEDTMCTGLQCKLPSVLCNTHINDGNAAPELRRWLSSNGINPNVMLRTVKSKEKDEVFNMSHANVNAKVRKTCQPENEWYHANYVANNYRSNDEISSHNKSVKTD